MNENNGSGSVNAENPDGNVETDMFQENQNPNRKDDDDEKIVKTLMMEMQKD